MIVVTAPTGNIGRQVVASLLDVDEPVRVVVRDAGRLPAGIRDRVEVVEGSHGDADVIDRALAGADALFWLAPPDQTRTLEQAYVGFTRPAADAIRRHGTGRVVGITALGRDTAWQDRAGLVTASIRMDDLLMETGAAYRGLAMPSFMDNILRQVEPIRAQGVFFGPGEPDKRAPATATRDMGVAAARLLADRSWQGRRDHPLLGPEDLSMDDMAAIVSDVLGREVRYQRVPYDRFKEQLLGRGASESFAQGYVDMFRAKDAGMDNLAVRTPETAAPTTFRQFCEDRLRPAVAG